MLISNFNILIYALFSFVLYLKKFVFSDIFFILSMFAVSVAVAVRETQTRQRGELIFELYINKGAFASAAVSRFYFFCVSLKSTN